MIQLEPQKYYPLTWNVPDPTDTTTYYVRAYVYTIEDGVRTLLDTLDMEDESDLTFFYNYQMPSDPSGQGRPLIVVYKAYTDSGYTTEQETYANRFTETYLVKETWNRTYMGGGVDYKKIDKLIKKRIKKIPKPKAYRETDLTPVIKSVINNRVDLDPVLQAIQSKETDLNAVYRWLGKLQMAIEALPQPEKLNLTPVLQAVSQINFSKVEKRLTNNSDGNVKLVNMVNKKIKTLRKEFKSRAFVVVPERQPKKKKEVKPKKDTSKEYRKYL